MDNMNRRNFLKVGGMSTVALALSATGALNIDGECILNRRCKPQLSLSVHSEWPGQEARRPAKRQHTAGSGD
ncbi:twin-arginine translocation signal domain-containing protein [Peribacillus glennii]|uniref:Twin-arginine translocation signal domain-containing protein n=1 Tax=Peribacillus glennii TaxID=2303991 RepID=A0A372LA20_9BACI|nr:twin-arginine translocation signal domain-containing protein [Peribacillus glennii]